MNREQLDNFIVGRQATLTEAMQKIDINSRGVVFVVDEAGRLCGAVSDGDIRRWLLRAGSLDAEIQEMMHTPPVFIAPGERVKAKDVMHKKCITVLPLVDGNNIIVDMCFAIEKGNEDISVYNEMHGVSAVIMAGGKGTRLYPYTKILPKPLIPIGEVPIVERVLEGFCEYGIKDFYMTVNYRKNMIESYFAESLGDYSLQFVEEDRPLGTGGSIRLIDRKFDRPLFVANCDSLVRTDYHLLYRHHMESGNAITMVTSLKNDTIPYGVIYSKEDGTIDHMVEKPNRSYLINTGMYIINPETIDLIPQDTMFHMTDLVEAAMGKGYQVGMYPVSEDSFLDMGEFEEMKRMEEKLKLSASERK